MGMEGAGAALMPAAMSAAGAMAIAPAEGAGAGAAGLHGCGVMISTPLPSFTCARGVASESGPCRVSFLLESNDESQQSGLVAW